MTNKILSFFGLMKISTAEQLSARLYRYHVKCVLDGVKKDFGATPSLEAIPKASKWWEETFSQIVKRGYDDVNITTPCRFKEGS